MNIITYIEFGNNPAGIFTHECPVTYVHTYFSRQFNAFHPSSTADCSSLDISIIAPPKENLFFQEWYIGGGVHSGRIRFELMNLDSKGEFRSTRCIRFYDAQCWHLGERYDIKDRSLRIMDLKLKPGRCVVDEVEFGEHDADFPDDSPFNFPFNQSF